jgi:HSP20 family protein
MAMMRFDPRRSFENVAKRMNEFMNEFDKGISFEYGSFAPRVDICEDETKFYVQAELPGLKKEEVKVTVSDDNLLVIKGEKKREEKEEDTKEGKYYIRVERNYGAFTRSFLLPDNVKKDNIDARFENGVLHITLDKMEPEKPKEMNVEIK